MTAVRTKKRKPTTAARIEMWLWFKDEATYRKFAAETFGRKADTISDREWVSATYLEEGPEGAVEGVFRFTHTCRNAGAHDSDSRRFFHATRRNASIAEGDADVEVVELLSRAEVSA
ncbi:hypothetical protein [Cryobacterium sp. TMT3-29-2]|uniref:hypothetical protein n=1 Tax=Cryobacterium sp. TMT3-29-2 TaxID=2555867 RepID=UPI00107309EB|nr:hypothetical protein [Cryobacterium sp. TMT3-29-2]TFC84500.1 hypothetical protein E3O67_12905 [Cryobacterium sp. TMT3-29-2]